LNTKLDYKYKNNLCKGHGKVQVYTKTPPSEENNGVYGIALEVLRSPEFGSTWSGLVSFTLLLLYLSAYHLERRLGGFQN
jgi:hypothetical protein